MAMKWYFWYYYAAMFPRLFSLEQMDLSLLSSGFKQIQAQLMGKSLFEVFYV